MGSSKIIFITGGQRSGKSSFAEKKALELSSAPIYFATAEVKDEEMEKRVRTHQAHRGANWTTVEEPLNLSNHSFKGKTVLFDCATLFTTNWFFKSGEDAEKTIANVEEQLNNLFEGEDNNFLVVSNEIGMCGISPNKMMRIYTDVQGMVNKFIASRADEVYFMVSGIPMKIK